MSTKPDLGIITQEDRDRALNFWRESGYDMGSAVPVPRDNQHLRVVALCLAAAMSGNGKLPVQK